MLLITKLPVKITPHRLLLLPFLLLIFSFPPYIPANPLCSHSWCNLLHIQFTAAGKRFLWDGSRDAHWGLRLYVSGTDPGLTFSIRLLKEIPSFRPIAVGPNPFLYPSGGGSFLPKAAAPRPHPNLHSPAPAAATTVYQPTMPAGPVSTADLILQMVNASAQALSNTTYERCWICYSPIPPFYEGIAAFGSPIYTNDTNLLRWGTQPQPRGMTLGQVVGSGLCLLGPRMLPPTPLLEACTQTMQVAAHASFLIAPNLTFFACSTGLSLHIIVDVFLVRKDYCVLVVLVPKLTVHPESDLLPQSDPTVTLSHRKRESVTALTLAILVGCSRSWHRNLLPTPHKGLC